MENIHQTINNCLNGDQRAQRDLYESFRTRWYMTSLRYGKNKMQAEDIFQEGMINIFRNLHSYDHSKAAFSTWSTRVLINAALTYLKKNNWADSMGELEGATNMHDQNETIYEKLSAKELTSLVQNLPVGYRLVFNLYVIEGYKHHEIAEQLGISEGTSKSQLFKAKRELKKVLELQLTSSGHE